VVGLAYVSVNAHGQVTLPAKMRSKLDIEPGSTLLVEEENSEIILRKARVVEQSVLDKLELIAVRQGTTPQDVVRAVRKIRNKIHSGGE